MINKTAYYIRSAIYKHVLFQSMQFSETCNSNQNHNYGKIKLKLERNIVIVDQVWDHIEDQVWGETL